MTVPNNPLMDPLLLGAGRSLTPAAREQGATIKAAKEFESILLSRLLNEMKETIGDWGMEKDNSTPQIQGIFWSHLAEELGDQGGIGLWRQMVGALDDKATVTQQTLLDTAL
jgi:Rod binding domain-containing protein